MKRLNRRAAGLAVVSLLAAIGGPISYTNAAAADPAPIFLSGNYFGDAREEILEYRPGTGLDQFLYNSQTDGTHIYFNTQSATFNNTYIPTVGDFDGDGFDEIFLLNASSSADYILDFNSALDFPSWTSIVTQQVGTSPWVITSGDYSADGADDIFLYRPGTSADYIWDFNPGSLVPAQQLTTIAVNGTYKPMSGRFKGDDGDDVIWYNAAAGNTALWDFEPGTFTPSSTAAYTNAPTTGMAPFTLDRRLDGGTDVLWYKSGTTTDVLWEFNFAGTRTTENMTINAAYNTTSGNYLNNDGGDVYWYGSQTIIWDYYTDATGLHKRDFVNGTVPGSLAATEGGSDTVVFTLVSDTLVTPADS